MFSYFKQRLKRPVGGLLILSYLSSFPAMGLESQGPSGPDLFRQARQKYLAGDHSGALADAERAIQRDPANWRAYQLAGYASYALKDKTAAAGYCRQSLQLHQDNPGLRSFVEKKLPEAGLIPPAPPADPTTPDPKDGPPSTADRISLAARLDQAQALKQADEDVRKLATAGEFTGGLAVGLLAGPALGAGGAILGAQLTYDPQGGWINLSGLGGALIGFTGGYLLGCLGGSSMLYNSIGEPIPEPAKYQGRSGDYIASYSREFREQGRLRKREEAHAGVIIGVLSSIAIPVAIALLNSDHSAQTHFVY